MVKFPSAGDFGRSSFGIDRDVRTRSSIASIGNAGAVGAAVAGLGQAISGVANNVMAVENKQKAEKDQLDNFNDQKRWYETFGRIDQQVDAAHKAMPADGSGYDQTVGGIFQQNTQQFLNGITDPKRRAKFEAETARAATSYDNRARSAMEAQRRNYFNTEIDNTATQAVEAVKRNPDSYDAAVHGVAQLAAKAGLDDQQKETFYQKWEPGLIKARIDGLHALGRHEEADALAKKEDERAGSRFAPMPSAPRGGRIAPQAAYSLFKGEAERQGLVGTVPVDGPRYGITTGSADEWARFFTGLAQHESGLNSGTVGDVGQFVGGSRGLLQLSYADAPRYGLNGGKEFTADQLADPAQNAAAGVSIAKQLMAKSGSIRSGMGQYWGPISKEGWTPGKGRDSKLPWANIADGGDASLPAPGTYSAYSYARDQQVRHMQLQADNQAAAAQKAQYDSWKNQTEFAIHDGNYGLADLQGDRENGTITDAGDYMRLEKMIQSRNEDQSTLATAISNISGKDYVFDPADKGDKQQVELYSQAMGTGDKIGKMDQDAIPQATAIVNRTGMVPKDVIGPVQALYRSRDVGAFNYGMSVLGTLYQQNPDVVEKAFGTKMARAAGVYNELSPTTSTDEMFKILKADADPAQAANRERLYKERDKALKDNPLTADGIASVFTPNLDKMGVARLNLSEADTDQATAAPPLSDNQTIKLIYDYGNLFRENYVATNGNSDAATKLTIQQLQSKWGESDVHGGSGPSWWRRMTGYGSGGRVMNYPPERFYQPVGGSYNWMKDAVSGALKKNSINAEDWELFPMRETEDDVKSGRPPRYGVSYIRPDGTWDTLRDEDNQPMMVSFDHGPAKRAANNAGIIEGNNITRRENAIREANQSIGAIGGNSMVAMPQEVWSEEPKTKAQKDAVVTNGPRIPE